MDHKKHFIQMLADNNIDFKVSSYGVNQLITVYDTTDNGNSTNYEFDREGKLISIKSNH